VIKNRYVDCEDFARLREGRLTVSASMFLKGLKMPSMADELAALRRMAASRRLGSRNHTLHSNNEPLITHLSFAIAQCSAAFSRQQARDLTLLDAPASIRR
jgi:hypothetical protein